MTTHFAAPRLESNHACSPSHLDLDGYVTWRRAAAKQVHRCLSVPDHSVVNVSHGDRLPGRGIPPLSLTMVICVFQLVFCARSISRVPFIEQNNLTNNRHFNFVITNQLTMSMGLHFSFSFLFEYF